MSPIMFISTMMANVFFQECFVLNLEKILTEKHEMIKPFCNFSELFRSRSDDLSNFGVLLASTNRVNRTGATDRRGRASTFSERL